jgi:hypothetical protein
MRLPDFNVEIVTYADKNMCRFHVNGLPNVGDWLNLQVEFDAEL